MKIFQQSIFTPAGTATVNAAASSPGGGPASFTFTRGTITTQTVIQAP